MDASVVTDALAVSGPAGDNARVLLADEAWLHAPALLGAEVTSALRAMVLRGDISVGAGRSAAVRAASLRARQYPFEPFLPRVWELRENLGTYDAWYVALAESLGTSLVTGDARLRRTPGPRCPVLSPAEVLA